MIFQIKDLSLAISLTFSSTLSLIVNLHPYSVVIIL